jgi:DNA-binding transcriptional MerR regulator
MEEMTLRELVAEAAVALSAAGLEQSSGRVSEVPTPRTIRYYARHGLIDKPIGWRGRAALYGRRHIAQIVAIKRMQADGSSLDQIQLALSGASDAELAARSGIALAAAPEATGPGADDAGAFWRRVPTDAPEPGAARVGQHEEEDDGQGAASAGGDLLTGARLDPGVALWVEGARRALDDDDIAAIKVAAEPLMRLLRARRIID